MARFVPRASFPVPDSIPKTYFLGHHHAGANKIKTILPIVSLVLECRDFRLPLSTQNPVLEQTIAGRERIIVYTKTDLGADSRDAIPAIRRLYTHQRTPSTYPTTRHNHIHHLLHRTRPDNFFALPIPPPTPPHPHRHQDPLAEPCLLDHPRAALSSLPGRAVRHRRASSPRCGQCQRDLPERLTLPCCLPLLAIPCLRRPAGLRTDRSSHDGP